MTLMGENSSNKLFESNAFISSKVQPLDNIVIQLRMVHTCCNEEVILCDFRKRVSVPIKTLPLPYGGGIIQVCEKIFGFLINIFFIDPVVYLLTIIFTLF